MRTWVEPRDIKLLLWEKLNTSGSFAGELASMAGLPSGAMQSFYAELFLTSPHPIPERDVFFFCTIDGEEYAVLLELCFCIPVEKRMYSRNKLLSMEYNLGKRFKKAVYVLCASETVLVTDREAERYPRKIELETLLRCLSRLTPERSGFFREVFDNLVLRSNYISGGMAILE